MVKGLRFDQVAGSFLGRRFEYTLREKPHHQPRWGLFGLTPLFLSLRLFLPTVTIRPETSRPVSRGPVARVLCRVLFGGNW